MAEGTDPAGDATTGHPGHDITRFSLAYDPRRGTLAGTVQLAGSPHWEHPAFLLLVAGMRTATGCNGFPAGGFLTELYDARASWLRMTGPDSGIDGAAEKRGAGSAVQTFEVTNRKLRHTRWNCLSASVVDRDDANIVYDSATVYGFRGMPELALRVPEIRRPLRAGQTRWLRITVSNPGDGPLRNVRLRINRPRGVKIAPQARLIRRIKPRGKATVTVRLTMTRRANNLNRLRITARAGQLVASEATSVARRRPQATPRPGGGGGGGDGSQTCLRFVPDLSGTTGGSLVMVPC